MKTTKQTEHTPSPWYIGDRGETAPHTSHVLGNDGSKVCAVESFPFLTTGKADARLIAAAPDLLAACEQLIDRLNEHTALIESCDLPTDTETALELGQAAIAKAKGEKAS